MDRCIEVLAATFPESEEKVWEACLGIINVGERRKLMEGFATFEKFDDYINLIGALICVSLAAIAAGLTIGIVSLEAIDLRVKIETGTSKEKGYASRLLPLVEKTPHHLVLVSLLLANSFANEALPLFLDELVPSWAAIVISVTVVLFVGELIPSAVFTGPSKLRVASACVPLAKFLIGFASPLAYPLALVLDRVMPEEPSFTSIQQVQAMVNIERQIAQELQSETPFHEDMADLVDGILELTEKSVKHRMVPIDKVMTISANAFCDQTTLQTIVNSGYSRIPIREEEMNDDNQNNQKNKFVYRYYLLVKELIGLEPDPTLRLIDVTRAIRIPLWTGPDHSLFSLLNDFQTGESHIAFISFDHAHSKYKNLLGIITLEDIIETMITEKIYDESDRNLAAKTITKFFSSKLSSQKSIEFSSCHECNDHKQIFKNNQNTNAQSKTAITNENRSKRRKSLLLSIQNKSRSTRNLYSNNPKSNESERKNIPLRRSFSDSLRSCRRQESSKLSVSIKQSEPMSISSFSERDTLLPSRSIVNDPPYSATATDHSLLVAEEGGTAATVVQSSSSQTNPYFIARK